MAIKLGLECKLYRDDSGTWNEIGNVRDLTINMEMGVADVTTVVVTAGVRTWQRCVMVRSPSKWSTTLRMPTLRLYRLHF